MTEATQIKCDTVIHLIIAETRHLREPPQPESPLLQMSQDEPRIGIIGAGRLGTSLAFLPYIQERLVAISSRREDHRAWLQNQIPSVTVVDLPKKVAEIADLVFITTSDAAIEKACDSIDWQPRHSVVHCSGVLTIDVLASAKTAGASVAGFHPLQTFPDYARPDRINNISYAIDCHDEDLDAWLKDFAALHNSRTFAIEGETAHTAYHASAVLACGMLAGLVGVSAELWQAAGIDRERALEMLSPMLKSTIEAITEDGLPNAISGPYVRGDLDTILKHLNSTAAFNPDTSRAYAALALAQLDIANEKGKLDQCSMNRMRRVLSDHLESL